MNVRRLRSALRVLIGVSESCPTAYRHPVFCSPHAWRCDLCGKPAVVTGPGPRAEMIHRCPEVVMGVNPTARSYVGVSAHLRQTWEKFWGLRPRSVSVRQATPSPLVSPKMTDEQAEKYERVLRTVSPIRPLFDMHEPTDGFEEIRGPLHRRWEPQFNWREDGTDKRERD